MDKLVSVVVPVYNSEEYLAECLDSVIRQTYENLEIILVDDGSSDGSAKICDDYAALDSRVKVIHRIKDSTGPGEARNIGAEAAVGEYLLFVDNDDWIDEKLVERTLEVAERNSADIVLFHFARVEEGKTVSTSSTSVKLPDNEVISAESDPEIIVCSCSPVDKLYRKCFWDENGFAFTVDRYFEDLGTIPKIMALTDRFVHIPDILYYYRIRPKSIMHDADFEKKYVDRTFVTDDVIDFFEKKGIYRKYYTELEYLTLKNAFFYPAREVVYTDPKSKYLPMFRAYVYGKFPKLARNKYIKQMPPNDRVFWFLIRHKMFGAVLKLSKLKTFVRKLLRR